MNTQELIAAGFLAAINLLCFTLFGIDKGKAKKGRFRIPERWFHLLALSGGFFGGYLGMALFRHKTRKSWFLVLYFLASLLSGTALILAWARFF